MSKKMKNPIKKCAEDLNRHFSKEDTRAQEKMLSISPFITEIQIETKILFS